MSELFTITFALLIAFIFAELFYHLKFPRVIGQLVGGLVLAIPLFKNNLFTPNTIEIFKIMASLGVVFLLLLTGMEIDIEKMKKNSKDALLIAVSAAITPFLLGLGLGHFLGYTWTTSFVLGTSLAVTAEGTKISILLELKKLKTKLGSIMLGAGILDDVFEVLFLSIVIVLAQDGNLAKEFYLFPLKIILFVIVTFFAYKFIPLLIQKIESEKSEIVLFNLTIIVGLICAMLSELVGLGSIAGAFIAGIILQKSFALKKDEQKEERNLELITFGFIIPFFFIYIGINFDYSSIIQNPALTFFVLITAIVGKLIGTIITKPFSSLSWKQLHLVGWGMNSRGVMELVIAEIARANGLISNEIFSAIVVMAITTTLIFPFVLKQIIKKNPKIMN